MSGKFFKHVEDKFLSQVLREPTREGALPDLLFEYIKGLVGEGMVGGCLGHGDHKIVEMKFIV